jgi:hypothetical protein
MAELPLPQKVAKAAGGGVAFLGEEKMVSWDFGGVARPWKLTPGAWPLRCGTLLCFWSKRRVKHCLPCQKVFGPAWHGDDPRLFQQPWVLPV